MWEDLILKQLEKNKKGLLRQDLMIILKIKKGNRTFNRDVVKLEKQGKITIKEIRRLPKKCKEEILYKPKTNQQLKVYYLPENKDEALFFWGLTEEKPTEKEELDNIHACWIFVEKGVVEPRKIKGYLYPVGDEEVIIGNYYERFLPISFLGVIAKYKGEVNSDFLVFLVGNKNDYPVSGLGANIPIETRIRTPISEFHSKNCRVERDSSTFQFKCDELLPDEIAFLGVLLSRKTKDIRIIEDGKEQQIESICREKAWYQNNPLKVRGAVLFKKERLDGYNVLVEWNANGIKKK